MKCPTGWLIEQIGDRWILHLLHQLIHGAQRTQTLLERLKGISSRTLAAKLKELEADGWITRRVYPEVPPRVEYELTEKGRTLELLLAALKQTGEVLFPGTETDCPSCQLLASTESPPVRQPLRSISAPQPKAQSARYTPSVDDVVLL
ncbi:MAG: helix-turn-helix transcriptional regulator [Acidobacteria bacterium]|nr:helix-turn-helix transcriptional regulator [Acidobacteriota bacterium]